MVTGGAYLEMKARLKKNEKMQKGCCMMKYGLLQKFWKLGSLQQYY